MPPINPLPLPRASHRYDLVLCDIDGCLAPESSHPFDLPSLNLIADHNNLAHAHHDRPVLTVCSGRPQPYAEAICKAIANRDALAACENGVWLYHPATNAYQLDPAITTDHLAAVRALNDWSLATFGAHGVTIQPGKAASVTLYHHDTDFLRSAVAPRVTEHIASQHWPFRVSMTWFYINCDLAHISKGTAIDRIINLHALDPARLVGIGDTTSDLPIRQRVAFFACPANAAPEIKSHADYVSPHPEARGVADILAHLNH